MFELLLASLVDAAMAPVYLGEFPTRPARATLPPIYAWCDFHGDVHIDTDRAALSRICITEAIAAGHSLDFGDVAVTSAVDQFAALADAITAEILLCHAASLQPLKSARARSALRWGTTR